MALAALVTAGVFGASSAHAAAVTESPFYAGTKPLQLQHDRVADLDDDWRKKVREADEDAKKESDSRSNARNRSESEPRDRYRSDSQRERSDRQRQRRSYSYGS